MARDTSIDVLLPVRNPNRFLRAAVNSTLRQLRSDKDFLFIIHEQSQFESLAEYIKLPDDRVKLLAVPDGSSLPSKLNHGLKTSHAKYIARMDADDVCLPWRLSRQRSLHKSSQAIILSTAIIFGRHLRPLPLLPQPPVSLNAEQFVQALIFGNPGVHPTLFADRNALIQVGGYREVPGEDLDLWLRLSLAGYPIIRDRIPAIFYRYHLGSMSHGKDNPLALAAAESSAALRLRLILRELGREPTGDDTLDQVRKEYLSVYSLNWRARLEQLDLHLNH